MDELPLIQSGHLFVAGKRKVYTKKEVKLLPKVINTSKISKCLECDQDRRISKILADNENGEWSYIKICSKCHAPMEGLQIYIEQ